MNEKQVKDAHAAKNKPKLWLNRYPIVHEDHVPDLEARAAVHEFKNRVPREQAELKAHTDYTRERALDAAAHHLVGLKAGHAAGNDEAAKAHAAAYTGAMQHAGFDPYQKPPQEITDRIEAAKQNVYSFKKHPADSFFNPVTEESTDADQHISDLLEKLKGQREQLQKPTSQP